MKGNSTTQLPLTDVRLVGSRRVIDVYDPVLIVDYFQDTILSDGREHIPGTYKCPRGHRHVVKPRDGASTRDPATVRWEIEPKSGATYCSVHGDHCYARRYMVCTIKTGTGECGEEVDIPRQNYYDRVVVVDSHVEATLVGRTRIFPHETEVVLVADELEPTKAAVEVPSLWTDGGDSWCEVRVRLDRFEMRAQI